MDEDPFKGEARYTVQITDQDGRVLFEQPDYILVHSTHPHSAAVRVASDARWHYQKDTSVLEFEVVATDNATGVTSRTGYVRSWETLFNEYCRLPEGARLWELDYSDFGGNEGYRYFRLYDSAAKARDALSILKRPTAKIRRLTIREIPFDSAITTED